MKKIITSFILGTFILSNCGSHGKGKNKITYPEDSTIYDDVKVHVSKNKIEEHDYYGVVLKLNGNVSIEYLTICKKML